MSGWAIDIPVFCLIGVGESSTVDWRSVDDLEIDPGMTLTQNQRFAAKEGRFS